MVDSAAMIAASGGQVMMHVHVFIAMTVLIMYFEWLPIVVASATIALHHVIGDMLFRNSSSATWRRWVTRGQWY